jgi:hypothetical protein
LPPFNFAALSRLMETSQSPGLKTKPDSSIDRTPGREIQPNVTTAPAPAPPRHGELLHQGSRGLGLNRWLCSQVRSCDSFDVLLDCARTYNQHLVSNGREPIEEIELVARTRAVWKDFEAGKLERWLNTPRRQGSQRSMHAHQRR